MDTNINAISNECFTNALQQCNGSNPLTAVCTYPVCPGWKKNPSTQLISGIRSHTAKPLGSHAGQTVRGRCNVCAARNRLRNMACFFCCCFPCRCRVCACVSKLNIHMHHHARLQQIQANRSVPVMYLRKRNNLFGSANGTTEWVMR